MFNTTIEFSNNPYLVMDAVACAEYYDSTIADEMTHKIISDIEITYDFYIN